MRLIAHGCSFTFGAGLETPAYAWPSLIGSKMGWNVLNLGRDGYANDGIVEDIININPSSEDDIVVIMWTWPHRLVLENEIERFSCYPGQSSNVSKLLMANINLDWMYRRWLTHVIALQDYLKTKNCKYLFVSAFPNNGDEGEKVTEEVSNLTNQIDSKYYLGWPDFSFNGLAEIYGRLPNEHPAARSHAEMATMIGQKLKELYDINWI